MFESFSKIIFLLIQIGVHDAGSYKVVLDTDAKEFDGQGRIDHQVYRISYFFITKFFLFGKSEGKGFC
jgi:hypothetical protein